ncbi:hypothetical protein T484DRAFT_1823295, partial [Baffinella frigidus]
MGKGGGGEGGGGGGVGSGGGGGGGGGKRPGDEPRAAVQAVLGAVYREISEVMVRHLQGTSSASVPLQVGVVGSLPTDRDGTTEPPVRQAGVSAQFQAGLDSAAATIRAAWLREYAPPPVAAAAVAGANLQEPQMMILAWGQNSSSEVVAAFTSLINPDLASDGTLLEALHHCIQQPDDLEDDATPGGTCSSGVENITVDAASFQPQIQRALRRVGRFIRGEDAEEEDELSSSDEEADEEEDEEQEEEDEEEDEEEELEEEMPKPKGKGAVNTPAGNKAASKKIDSDDGNDDDELAGKDGDAGALSGASAGGSGGKNETGNKHQENTPAGNKAASKKIDSDDANDDDELAGKDGDAGALSGASAGGSGGKNETGKGHQDEQRDGGTALKEEEQLGVHGSQLRKLSRSLMKGVKAGVDQKGWSASSKKRNKAIVRWPIIAVGHVFSGAGTDVDVLRTFAIRRSRALKFFQKAAARYKLPEALIRPIVQLIKSVMKQASCRAKQ